MATRIPTITAPGPRLIRAVWTGLLNGDVGQALDAPGYPDKTVCMYGTFGVGGTIVVQGRGIAAGVTDSDYTTLNDTRGEGNALTFTASDVRTINENPDLVRPSVTAGDGSTSLICIITAVARG